MTKVESPNKSMGAPGWEGIVIHFTNGYSAGSSYNWFMNPASKASAHMIVERNGNIFECVSTKNRAWHAGQSSFFGRSNCNNSMLGIEVANLGPLTVSNNKIIDTYGKPFNGKWVQTTSKNNKGAVAWEEYPQEQVIVVAGICNEWIQQFDLPACAIVGHENVSYKRKFDPGPAWNWNAFYNLLDKTYNDTNYFLISIQSMLENYGYECGEIDGFWGAYTSRALDDFCNEKLVRNFITDKSKPTDEMLEKQFLELLNFRS